MEHENEITGRLASCEIKNIGNQQVANFELQAGGAWNKVNEKYELHYFPLEAWLKDQVEKLQNAKIGDVLTVRYRAYPKRIDTGKYKIKIIVWKTVKLFNWTSKGGANNESESHQISFDEKLFEK